MAIQPLRLDPITVLGKQLVIELFDCVDQRFDDIQWIEESMLEAARQANATIITSAFHKFSKGPVMKLWLQNLAWQLGVALGLIEPPRMQPIPVENDEQRRRLAARQRR